MVYSRHIEFLKSPAKPTWVANNSKSAASTIRKLNSILDFMRTHPNVTTIKPSLHLNMFNNREDEGESHDFSNMYDTTSTVDIIQTRADILKRIAQMLKESGAILTCILIMVDPQTANITAEWSKPLKDLPPHRQKYIKNKKGTIMTLDEYHDHYKNCMTHAYVQFDGYVYKQISGIPQGMEAGVTVCNLLISAYEHAFTIQCIKNKDLHTLWELQHAIRYIDDVLLPNTLIMKDIRYQHVPYPIKWGPNTGKLVPEIYPQGLKVNLESTTAKSHPDLPPNSISFLDHLYTLSASGYWHINSFDKRILTKMDFSPLSRFTPAESCIWKQAKSGAFMSELDRHFYANTSYCGFVVTTAATMLELYLRAYPWQQLHRTLKLYIKRKPIVFANQKPPPNHDVYNDIMIKVDEFYLAGLPLFTIRNARLGFKDPPSMPTQAPPTRRLHRNRF